MLTASQELAYGGLKPETVARLEALGEQLDGGNVTLRRIRGDQRPLAGTRLIREYQGVEHVVTVTRDGFEWQGRPYQSLSAIARAITGTRWNGWTFFGLRKARRMSRRDRRPMPAKVRKLRCAVYTRKSTDEGLEKEFNSPRRAARGLRGLSSPASAPRAGCWCATATTTAGSPAARWSAPR